MNATDIKWHRVVSGTYISADHKFKIQRSFSSDMRANGWQLLKSNNVGGWDWCNTYQLIVDAQDAAAELI